MITLKEIKGRVKIKKMIFGGRGWTWLDSEKKKRCWIADGQTPGSAGFNMAGGRNTNTATQIVTLQAVSSNIKKQYHQGYCMMGYFYHCIEHKRTTDHW